MAYALSRSNGAGGILCGCPWCPTAETLDAIFNAVADPCPTGCIPTTQQPGPWINATSLPINGGHELVRSGSVWFIVIPNAFEFQQFDNDACTGTPSDATADIVIQVNCHEAPNEDGKHLGLLVNLLTSSGGGFIYYTLFDLLTDPADWFNFDEEVILPGPCGGTFIVASPE